MILHRTCLSPAVISKVKLAMEGQSSLPRSSPNSDEIENLMIHNRASLTLETYYATLNKFPRLRDFYNNPSIFATAYQVYETVANFLNTSVSFFSKFPGDFNSSHLILKTDSIWFAMQTPQEMRVIFNSYLEGKNKSGINPADNPAPEFVMDNTLGNSFVYCKDSRQASRNFFWEILQNPEYLPFWLCLIVSVVLVSGLSRYATVVLIKTNIQLGKVTCNILSALSPLLAAGVTGASKQFSYSWLFALWTVISFLIGTFFSGEIISGLVKPLTDMDRITDVNQLLREKYTLFFEKRHPNPKALQEMVEADLQRYAKRNWSGRLTESLETTKTLLANSIKIERKDFMSILASANRHSTIYLWFIGLLYATRATEHAKKKGHLTRRCYIGEELILTTKFFHTFTNGQNTRVATVFQRIFHSGIYGRWTNEFEQMASSTRVQNRPKQVSLHAYNNGNTDLGEVANQLVLDWPRFWVICQAWFICILACVLVFKVELLNLVFCDA